MFRNDRFIKMVLLAGGIFYSLSSVTKLLITRTADNYLYGEERRIYSITPVDGKALPGIGYQGIALQDFISRQDNAHLTLF